MEIQSLLTPSSLKVLPFPSKNSMCSISNVLFAIGTVSIHLLAVSFGQVTKPLCVSFSHL